MHREFGLSRFFTMRQYLYFACNLPVENKESDLTW